MSIFVSLPAIDSGPVFVAEPCPMVRSRTFGRLPDGTEVQAYTMGNASMELQVITYGGIVTRLLVPDRSGLREDVVLGFDRLEPYLAGHPYFGCITGRVAGRITAGVFELEGHRFALAVNNGPNHLHGGWAGLDKKNWRAQVPAGSEVPELRLQLTSPDGEEGYPGTLRVEVIYRLLPPATWEIDYRATTDRPTLVNLTQHAYFHLGGEGSGTVENHRLEIHADNFMPTDGDLTLLGVPESVEGKPDDLRVSRRLGDVLPALLHQHGNLYATRPAAGLRRVAKLSEPESGRIMEVWTEEPAIQFYAGSFLDGSLTGKSGRPYRRHAGLCLECQRYPMPGGPPGFGSPVVLPAQGYRQKTQYRFFAN